MISEHYRTQRVHVAKECGTLIKKPLVSRVLKRDPIKKGAPNPGFHNHIMEHFALKGMFFSTILWGLRIWFEGTWYAWESGVTGENPNAGDPNPVHLGRTRNQDGQTPGSAFIPLDFLA